MKSNFLMMIPDGRGSKFEDSMVVQWNLTVQVHSRTEVEAILPIEVNLNIISLFKFPNNHPQNNFHWC